MYKRFPMSLIPPKVLRYSFNHKIRNAVQSLLSSVTERQNEEELDLRREWIGKILIVRSTFRMGDSLLALPAIWSFRKRFPSARIDFLGAPISKQLFKNLPIDNHYTVTRRFPASGWHYPLLIRQLRSVKYDLAVDVSCSQSSMAAFIVGFSDARYRIGTKGKWDHWFNVRIPKSSERNKYRTLRYLLESLGLEYEASVPWLPLTRTEEEQGRTKVEALNRHDSKAPIVGVFIGGRKTWGKRWPVENFRELIIGLCSDGVNVVVFAGPEERDVTDQLRSRVDPAISIVFEPSVMKFAAMLSSCDLFVTCDSGPMHLAYTLGVRTVAIFLYGNFDHWGPPRDITRVVYAPGGGSAIDVLKACREELMSVDRSGTGEYNSVSDASRLSCGDQTGTQT